MRLRKTPQLTTTAEPILCAILSVQCLRGVLVAVYTDLTDGEAGFTDVGYLWFQLAPDSLQISEAIISRYIDPCGLFVSLDCEPFLWHPAISFFLLLPAAPFFIGVTALLILLRKYREGREISSHPAKKDKTRD